MKTKLSLPPPEPKDGLRIEVADRMVKGRGENNQMLRKLISGVIVLLALFYQMSVSTLAADVDYTWTVTAHGTETYSEEIASVSVWAGGGGTNPNANHTLASCLTNFDITDQEYTMEWGLNFSDDATWAKAEIFPNKNWKPIATCTRQIPEGGQADTILCSDITLSYGRYHYRLTVDALGDGISTVDLYMDLGDYPPSPVDAGDPYPNPNTNQDLSSLPILSLDAETTIEWELDFTGDHTKASAEIFKLRTLQVGNFWEEPAICSGQSGDQGYVKQCDDLTLSSGWYYYRLIVESLDTYSREVELGISAQQTHPVSCFDSDEDDILPGGENYHDYSCYLPASHGGTLTLDNVTANVSDDRLVIQVTSSNHDQNTDEVYGQIRVTAPVQNFADLAIESSDISFDPEIPLDEEVAITAEIHNVGSRPTNGVVVRFFDGDPSNGDQIDDDQVLGSISPDDQGEAEVIWDTDGEEHGIHVIFVVVDPDDTVSEGREDNNQASREISHGKILSGEVYDGHAGPLVAGIPYLIVGHVTVPYDPTTPRTLTVQPGATLFFKSGYKMMTEADATLRVNANSDNPTYLISYEALLDSNGIKLTRDLVLKNGGEFKPEP